VVITVNAKGFDNFSPISALFFIQVLSEIVNLFFSYRKPNFMIFVRFFCSKPIIAFNGGVDSNVYIQGEKKGPKSSANQHSKKKKR